MNRLDEIKRRAKALYDTWRLAVEDHPRGYTYPTFDGLHESHTFGWVTLAEALTGPECADMAGEITVPELWFYVPDYPAVKDRLEFAYMRFGVEEWSAEPGQVAGRPDDADIHVRGGTAELLAFREWLKVSEIEGLMIEGEEVEG